MREGAERGACSLQKLQKSFSSQHEAHGLRPLEEFSPISFRAGIVNMPEHDWELCTPECTRRGLTLRKDVFLPSKHLPSAFYETLPSENPSKNLVFTENPLPSRPKLLQKNSL